MTQGMVLVVVKVLVPSGMEVVVAYWAVWYLALPLQKVKER